MVTPVEAQVISDLIALARQVNKMLVYSVQIENRDFVISETQHANLVDMMTVLDLLPADGHVAPGSVKAAYALQHILGLLPGVMHDLTGSLHLPAPVSTTSAKKLADFITAEKLAEHIEAVGVGASKMANNSPWNSLDELGKSMRNAAESLHKFNVVVTQRPAGLSDSEWLVVQNMRKLDMAKIDFTTSIPEGFTFRPYSSMLRDIPIQPPQSVMRMVSGINVPDALPDAQGHVLFTDEDNAAPKAIYDRNGNVVLGLCKLCGKGEAELSEPCPGKKGDL